MSKIIIFSADTLRKDKLGTYKNKDNLTPNIDNFSKDSLVFNNAFSTSSWTAPAFASMLTGKYPNRLGFMKYNDNSHDINMFLSQDVKTITEIYKERGYATACFQGNWGVCYPETGFNRGFDIYYYKNMGKVNKLNFVAKFLRFFNIKKYLSYSLIKETKKFISKNIDKDFFVWINLCDCHCPYLPRTYLRLKDYIFKDLYALYVKKNGALLNLKASPDVKLTKSQKEYIKYKYGLAVKTIDMHFGNLLDFIKKLGIYDDTKIVFVSDHGEAFFEHGDNRSGTYDKGVDHGHTFYNEITSIPLIVKDKHKGGNNRYVNIRNIFSILENNISYDPYLFLEGISSGTEKRAVISKGFKLIHLSKENLWELYDLNNDMFEEHNLHYYNDLNKSFKSNLVSKLLSFEKDSILNISKLKLNGKAQEVMLPKLKALGYI